MKCKHIIAISLYYAVAKGSEGGEENLRGHKLTAQTYSASVGVKPEVVIWEALRYAITTCCKVGMHLQILEMNFNIVI